MSAAKTIHQDFLTTDPCSEENMRVEYTIVDPSCSGSGMASRKDYLVDDDMQEDKARLRSLHQLQCRILSHALSFPSVRRVVYSTCSVHREENEDVVRTVLKQCDGFRLVPVMQGTWDRRGLSTGQDGEEDHIGECCVRASPQKDLTNGFFVALFERTGKSGTGSSKRRVPELEDTINGHCQSLDEKHSKKKKKAKVGIDETVESQEEALKADVMEDDQIDKNERKKKKKKQRKEDEMNIDVCFSDEISDDVKQIKKKHKKSENESEESDELVVDKCEKKEKKKKGSKRKSSENSDSAPLVTDQASEESQPSAKKKKKKTKKTDM